MAKQSGSYFQKSVVSNPQTKESTTEVPRGGIKNQVLVKNSNSDYDTVWKEQPAITEVRRFYTTKNYESASLTGISEELALAYAIVLG
jgi:hypothetical protein